MRKNITCFEDAVYNDVRASGFDVQEIANWVFSDQDDTHAYNSFTKLLLANTYPHLRAQQAINIVKKVKHSTYTMSFLHKEISEFAGEVDEKEARQRQEALFKKVEELSDDVAYLRDYARKIGNFKS